MTDKVILARLKKAGTNFEISVDADLAIDFKEGKNPNLSISEVLKSENIFSDVKKGMLASSDDLQKAFQTSDPLKVAEEIIKKGEVQVTAEHRNKEREQKKRQLITKIHQLAINPTNNLPHPITRIEAALEQAKFHITEHKSVDELFEEALHKLRPIIPLKIEKRVLNITVQASQIGKLNNPIRKNSKILKEDWDSQGNWRIKVEIPAGMQQELIDLLNKLTQGNIQIDIENDKRSTS